MENIFLFSNKRLLKYNILVKQKINNKRLFYSSLKKDNMSSDCLRSMLFPVTPLKWGHLSGIQCLHCIHWIQSLQSINFLQHIAKITGGFITPKQTIHWNASLTFDASEASLNTSLKVSTWSTEHCRATILLIWSLMSPSFWFMVSK